MASGSRRPTGQLDPILYDSRVLQNMLSMEGKFMTSTAIFGTLQQDVTEFMRVRLGSWLYCVCEDCCCPAGTLTLCLSILDRFLQQQPVQRTDFQKLGAACLLIACKLRLLHPISTATLCYLSADSFTKPELVEQEKLVLEVLKWRTEAILASDFTSHLLSKIQPIHDGLLTRWHQQTNNLVDRALIDPRAGALRPSVLSAACCLLAASAQEGSNNNTDTGHILCQLACALGIDVSVLSQAKEQVLILVSAISVDIFGSQ
ncbi:cyclin [Colobine gammaherpesvirus 1]|uniref:Cyclin n=1 Tax=Colobine gammaherpesvirus 1 TaxID=2597325 RepID=A0A5B8FKP3_9GAMA|nr:cyclin [Colobine gammaherpesvirus 1]QDQ69283.1 cyclin [Colobine gammaherpesvirus 1]